VQLQIGLAGRLIDYYPKVDFIVWRRDHCPDLYVPEDNEKILLGLFPFLGKHTTKVGFVDKNNEEFDKHLRDYAINKDIWHVPDTAAVSYRLHLEENKTELIDNEAYLHGWSEKVFSSEDTTKLWKLALQKNQNTKLKNKVKKAACILS